MSWFIYQLIIFVYKNATLYNSKYNITYIVPSIDFYRDRDFFEMLKIAERAEKTERYLLFILQRNYERKICRAQDDDGKSDLWYIQTGFIFILRDIKDML